MHTLYTDHGLLFPCSTQILPTSHPTLCLVSLFRKQSKRKENLLRQNLLCFSNVSSSFWLDWMSSGISDSLPGPLPSSIAVVGLCQCTQLLREFWDFELRSSYLKKFFYPLNNLSSLHKMDFLFESVKSIWKTLALTTWALLGHAQCVDMCSIRGGLQFGHNWNRPLCGNCFSSNYRECMSLLSSAAVIHSEWIWPSRLGLESEVLFRFYLGDWTSLTLGVLAF